MPGLNATGPLGAGARTGRQLGRCREEIQETTQVQENTGNRHGFRFRFQTDELEELRGQERGWRAGFGGRGKGRGRGMGNRFGNRK
ncbi:DUF5320 domain-containing protein [Maribellus sediminis]|uniref:DUF5320 domain-containing protein n=1 Tax=Maribellus sediminis TaxID=2696285 RepID=UPI001430F9D0|nr:DUF5320 domain-containing protein [Maribellus sediminis]